MAQNATCHAELQCCVPLDFLLRMGDVPGQALLRTAHGNEQHAPLEDEVGDGPGRSAG